ncbi:hypothetical protein SEVIR_3G336600v4 [Setaria viridis]|uniref:Uncharacterized protein n=1 Tax=Setaria viridis TaxID=4556 RepID=A0A4U6VJ38_SETVI|nr:uncharacterized protein LOC117847588 [Setaria viridis]TKW28564.1 hypothetical protein SEVIR_3G336600v2 [Setaria viridis]
MAHHHSPSPSGSSSRRRLSELLGEQQEPFYLDLYLLEKGCSPAFLDAAACGGGASACSTCWPRARSTGGRLLRRPAARRKKGRGVLRLLLSKILSGATTTAPAAAAAKKKRQQRPAAIGWRRPDADVKRTTPVRSANAGVPASPSAVECHHRTEVDEEREEEDDGEDEDEDESSKKQLSPVSVLERRLFEHLPPPPHAQKAFVLFSELLEAACTPTTLLSLLANAKQFRNSSKDGGGGSTPTTTPRRFRKKNNSHARREDTLPFERDLATATALVSSELAGARVRPEHVGPEREDIAADIAAAVLDAMTEEAAAELMMTMRMDQPWVCG